MRFIQRWKEKSVDKAIKDMKIEWKKFKSIESNRSTTTSFRKNHSSTLRTFTVYKLNKTQSTYRVPHVENVSQIGTGSRTTWHFFNNRAAAAHKFSSSRIAATEWAQRRLVPTLYNVSLVSGPALAGKALACTGGIFAFQRMDRTAGKWNFANT